MYVSVCMSQHFGFNLFNGFSSVACSWWLSSSLCINHAMCTLSLFVSCCWRCSLNCDILRPCLWMSIDPVFVSIRTRILLRVSWVLVRSKSCCLACTLVVDVPLLWGAQSRSEGLLSCIRCKVPPPERPGLLLLRSRVFSSYLYLCWFRRYTFDILYTWIEITPGRKGSPML